jgi:Amt family ammonium transporter
VFVNTNAAAAGGLLAALVLGHLLYGKADLTMAVNGALAGLVAITADPLSATGGMATLIGAIGGAIVVVSVSFFDKLRIDDPVGAISVHGVVGIWGLLAVTINSDVTVMAQLTGAVVIFAWTFVTSSIVWFILKSVMGIRVSEEQEYEGVDISECGVVAYPEFDSK